MIDWWLGSGTAGIILIPFAVLFALAAGMTWLTHRSPARPFFASCIGVTGPFFGSVAILFALFAAFLANDVWRQIERAQTALAREADGVRTILRLAEAEGGPGKPLTVAVVGYSRSVMDSEWSAMRQGKEAAETVDALHKLALAVVNPQVFAGAPPALHQAVVDAFVEIRQARTDRIAISTRHGASINWLAMVILGILTQVAVAVVHLDKIRPQVLALCVFTAAFASTVALVGINERPFAGVPIDDAPLRAALASAAP
jgi:hypothetical protein